MSGKHIELFLVDGEPGGITTANVSGWTGHILSGPRTALTRILARDEAHRNGVYLLLGDDPDAIENIACYIGRTEDFSARFRQHDRQKDWWDRAVLISSRDDSFNEGHWGYLEARLVEIASTAKRCSLPDNAQTPQPRKLSEAQQSDTEAFLDQVRGVLPVLGVSIVRSTKTLPGRQPLPQDIDSPVFTLAVPKRDIHAQARVIGDEFIMLEGSRVVGEWTNKVLRAPVASTNPTAHDTTSLLMTGASPSMVSPALSHGTSLSPHHPLPGLSPPVDLATVVPPGSGQAAPTVTGRTGTSIPRPQSQQNLSNPDESVLP